MNDVLESLRVPVLLTAGLAAGLQAGTYYAWATGVMPGLARVDDRTFVHAMQEVNVAIVNPAFLATFLGAPALAGAAIVVCQHPARPWAVAALALAIGTVAITAVGNIPLNNALDGVTTDLTAARADFETAWSRWNLARCVTSAGALGSLLVAALRG